MNIHYHEDEAVLESQEDETSMTGYDEDDFAETVLLDSEVAEDALEDDTGSGEEAYRADGHVDDLVGENSVVFDVDDLVAEFEAEAGEDNHPSSRLRRRLEAIAERKRRHDDLMDFDDYDLDG